MSMGVYSSGVSQSNMIRQSEMSGSSASVGHLAGHTLTLSKTPSFQHLNNLLPVPNISQTPLNARHVSLPPK
ncbi:MAG: hypothetical protein LBB19_02510 [Puniceicoccales bacterium]|jgi:hypothetical protein|nr:hypothetical protein [Puniceicoccales bacterium]